VTIVGRPNTGKSSLFNALVGKERAIVTPHPGTTRDTLESIIDLQGIPLTLIDTAGVRSARDEIEAIGIRRTEAEIHQADLIIMLLDASEPLQKEDQDLWEKVYDKEHLVVFNKIDLAEPDLHLHQLLNPAPQSPVIKVSALKRLNLDKLEEAIIKKLLLTEIFTEEGLLISNLRHINSLRQSYTALNSAIEALQNNQSGELVMIDLNEALQQLNSILGLEIGEEILDRIFSRFCIGK
ncbi:MAG: GTP-binding protein, partial [Candidatus Sumerlaeia bacterium]|nr:GTP-binding protein [Candidatus Sumerlaeia bacterium]